GRLMKSGVSGRVAPAVFSSCPEIFRNAAIFLSLCVVFASSRSRHTISTRDWSSDVCSSDLAPGATRVTAPCPHYVQDRCGGCQLQHVTYEAQLAAKRAIVGDALRRIAKLDVEDPEIVEAVEEWRYRAKVSLAVKGGRGRSRAVGFHQYD